jgi:outer membrane protein TolC
MSERLRFCARQLRHLARVLALPVMIAACFAPARAQDFLVIPDSGQTSGAEELTLKRAVALALQNSHDLALARLQYTVALNQAKVDRADFRPNIYTGAGYVYSNGIPQTPGGTAPSIFSLEYTQQLFNPLLRGQYRADQDLAKNRQLEIDRTRDAVIVRTATTYLDLAKVRHALELLRTEQASAQKILDYTRERAASGFELPLEVTRGELTMAKIEHQILQLEGRDDVLTEELRSQTALPESQALNVAPEELPEGAQESVAELESLALQNSVDVREAENERSAREHYARGAHQSYWPTVQLIGEYSVLARYNNYQEFYTHFQRNNLNVGIQVHIPIFAAKTSAAVALAKSELAQANAEVGSKRQDVRIDVRQKARSMRELEAGREVARLDLKLAQETLAITQSRFDKGQSSLRELEQDRLTESEKWVEFLDADFARKQGQLTLLQSTGQLAQVFQ